MADPLLWQLYKSIVGRFDVHSSHVQIRCERCYKHAWTTRRTPNIRSLVICQDILVILEGYINEKCG